MEQVKVTLALSADGVNGTSTYSTILSNLIHRSGVQIPNPDEEIVINSSLAYGLKKAADQTVRHMSIAQTWTFLMPISRYVRLCKENPSDSDPLSNVHGFISHVLEGDEIEFMTGYREVISVVRKVKSTKTLPALTMSHFEMNS